MVRQGSDNTLQRTRQLFSQYLVDQYCKMEAERLLWIKLNQKTLRTENYEHLRDALAGETNLHDIGKATILPSSFVGGPRYMQQKNQDAMAYVAEFGKPDLFITFTCNPYWDEIQRELFEGQTAADRHDLVCRVFRAKLKELKKFLLKEQVFGKHVAYIHTIEWQKVFMTTFLSFIRNACL